MLGQGEGSHIPDVGNDPRVALAAPLSPRLLSQPQHHRICDLPRSLVRADSVSLLCDSAPHETAPMWDPEAGGGTHEVLSLPLG